MHKKHIMLVAFLIVAMSGIAAYATTWSLQTRVTNAGGSIQVGASAPRTYINGTVLKNYTTSKLVPVAFLPNPGYQVTAYSINGTAQPIPAPGSVNMGLPAFNPTVLAQTMSITFGQIVASVSAAVSPGGAVSPTGTKTYPVGTSVSYIFTPDAGLSVIAISGVPAGATLTNAAGAGVTLPYAGSVTLTFAAPATPVSLYGTFIGVAAKASGPSVVLANVPAKLTGTATIYDGSSPSAVSYAWTQIGGPVAAIANASTATPTITAPSIGSYQFQLLVTNSLGATGIDVLSLDVISSPTAVARNMCQGCHATRGIGDQVQVFPKWSTARHSRMAVMCWYCHVGADTGAHPGPGITSSTLLNICKSCHVSFASPTPPGHLSKAGTDGCTKCHDPHSTQPTLFLGAQAPHFNNVTEGNYPASYVGSQAVCSNCHSPNNDSASADQNRHDWAGSKHGATRDAAWTAYDFKTLDGCVRCHTATGFVAYSTSRVTAAWGVSSDKSKEVLACNGCHNQDFTVRTVKPYSSDKAFTFQVNGQTTVSAPYQNSDYATSNVCIPCHSGTTSGEIVKRAFAFGSFTAVGRLTNHFMAGAGVLDNNVGYEFEGTPGGKEQDFNKQNTWHSGIGIATLVDTGNKGPCIACHMSTPGRSHTFSVVFKNTSGSITSVSGQSMCDKCHPSARLGGGVQMTVETLLSLKNGYTSALAALKAQLKVKGIDPDQPALANWGSTQLQRSNNAGAYYNYLLLKNSDAGAYAHNPTYAKRLIKFSIDWMDDASFNNSTYDAIYALNLDADTREAAVSYLGVNPTENPANCFRCHKAYYN